MLTTQPPRRDLLAAVMLVAAAVLGCVCGAGGAVAASSGAATLQGQLNTLIAGVAGPGKGFAIVSQTVNASRTTQARVRYGPTGVALTGAGSSIRWRAATSGAARARTVQWGRDVTLSRRIVAPGATTRLDVALVLDRSIPPATARRLAAAVATASGLRRGRGDRLVLLRSRLPVPPTAPAAAAALTTSLKPYAGSAAIGIGALGFLTFMVWTIGRARRR
jgi:flagellar M-ring protein FliF